MADLSIISQALASVRASEATLQLLRDLHTQALEEPPYVSTDDQAESAALDRFVALDPDKCALVYLLLRATGARYVVEAGTSFGLSTIYLALAVGQNAKFLKAPGKVIATEKEEAKASRARQHWKRAGDEVEKWIELREGDLRETLKTNLHQSIDFLLLDIWTPLAMPTLAVVKPHLRTGAMVVVDNVIVGKEGYKELMDHLADPKNGFRTTTVPYAGGLQVVVYVGAEGEA
ncbi:O-methyltransferase [Hypoxylon sp. FL1284]|nr:O-methyltransferase [Hypoxylon sp. FL1284]